MNIFLLHLFKYLTITTHIKIMSITTIIMLQQNGAEKNTITKHTYAKTIFLNCKLSTINSNTTNNPFFMSHTDLSITPEKLLASSTANQTFDITPKINSSLDPTLQTLYTFLDSPKREFTYGPFTFLSLCEIKKRNNNFIENNQHNICDLAVSYYGMGNVIVLSWDTNNQCYFMRIDGGPNDYERIDNFKFITTLDTNTLDEKYKIAPSKLFEIINVNSVEELCSYFLTFYT